MKLKRRQFLTFGSSFLTTALLGAGLGDRTLSHASTAPAVAKNLAETLAPKPFRIAVISDLNESQGSVGYGEAVERVISQIPTWQPDLVLCSGDMVAGQDRNLTDDEIQAMWNTFDRTIAAPLRRLNIPYGFAIGNHDASRAQFGTELIYERQRTFAAAYWDDPAHHPGLSFVDRHKFPFYYTFQQNQVFFLVWDASVGAPIPAEDRAWIDRSLSSPVAQNAAMRIVVGHMPLYAVAQGRDRIGDVLGDAAALHAMLERHRVHTYISGHHHAYFPGRLGNLEMLHAGALGFAPRRLLDSQLPPHKTATLLDFDLNTQDSTYTTYELPSLLQIDQVVLPRTILSQQGLVIRRDLTWADLTPAERQACQERLPSYLCHT